MLMRVKQVTSEPRFVTARGILKHLHNLNLSGYIPRSLLRKSNRIAFHTPQLAAEKLIVF
jgi:hypothetical protein